MRSPICWFGGKGNFIKNLLPLLPLHHTYVEVFGGGASLLFAKAPSPVEVYNDLNGDLANFFRVLRSPKAFKKLQHLTTLTPYARQEFTFCRAHLNDKPEAVIRAYRFFIVARMSFAGKFGSSFGTEITENCGNMAKNVFNYLKTLEHLPQVHQRLMRVQIENQDFKTILERYDTPNTFFYLDPPYVHSTRKAGSYSCELTDADHKEMVHNLLGLQGKALLSGYWHSIYQPLIDAGWHRKDYQMSCYAAAKTKATGIQGKGSATKMQPRTETVLLSPNCLTGWGLRPISL